MSTSISGEIYSQLVIDRETAMNTLWETSKTPPVGDKVDRQVVDDGRI
jgi:hypothetical protein